MSTFSTVFYSINKQNANNLWFSQALICIQRSHLIRSFDLAYLIWNIHWMKKRTKITITTTIGFEYSIRFVIDKIISFKRERYRANESNWFLFYFQLERPYKGKKHSLVKKHALNNAKHFMFAIQHIFQDSIVGHIFLNKWMKKWQWIQKMRLKKWRKRFGQISSVLVLRHR